MYHLFLLALCFSLSYSAQAQFHTLTFPRTSNKVVETQRLGVTDITISYHSPTVRGRDVWNDPNVIPQNGDPIPWRAGANMNTTIDFSTDVMIEGQALAAGTYGFHIIPKADHYILLFAHNHEQWGSYYLDIAQDISLQVDVQATACSFSEKLDYEFIPDTENSIIIGLEWSDRRLPFRVTVDLNQTVVASFRDELRGINTYRWEAWNDAAQWCLDHNTNLEEALSWADRSINGGYSGFAANINLTNLRTKAHILHQLHRKDEFQNTIAEARTLNYSAYEANDFSRFLLDIDQAQAANDFCLAALEKYPNTWFLLLNRGISQYFLGDKTKANDLVQKAKTGAPTQFTDRLSEIIQEIEAGTYQLPGR